MDNGITLGIGGNSTGAVQAINATSGKLKEMLGIANAVKDAMADVTAMAGVMGKEVSQSFGTASDGLKELLGATTQQNEALDDLAWAAEEARMSIGQIGADVDGFENVGRAAHRAKGSVDKATKAVEFFTEKNSYGLTAVGKLMKSIARIAFYRIVRDAIKRVGNAFAEGTQNLVQYSAAMNSIDAARANETMSEFATISLWVKDSIGAAVMPILRSLIPLVNMVADVFVFATNAINQFVQALRGKSDWTEALKYPVDYAEKLNGVGKAAKEAKKQIFGFDELNIFTAPSDGGSGSTPTLDYSSLFKESKVGDGYKAIAEDITNNLTEIESAIGKLGLTVGFLLLASGQIGLGMGAILVGAQQTFKSQGIDWNSLGTTVQTKLENLIAFTSPVLLAMGALISLMVPSALPMGLALMAAGATATGVTALGGAKDELSPEIQKKLETLIDTTSLVVLSLGVILAFTNPAELPLALGLIASGAVGLGASNASINWDSFSTDIKDKIYAIVGAVSVAHLAVGMILALTMPSKLPLALGLLAVGAVGMGTAAQGINWDNVPETMKDKLRRIFEIVSVAELAVGAILFFTTGSPKGLALMLSGMPGSLAAFIDIVTWLNEHILEPIKKRVTEWWEEKKKDTENIGVQFIDSILEGMKRAWRNITEWLSGKTLNIRGKTTITEAGGSTFQMQADGGFVDSGQMFIAREAGPELVGTIGNQTAVANNGQIIEGIAAGVANAMTNTNSAIYQMANAVVDAIANKEINTTVISDRDIYQSAQRGKTLSGRTVYA